MNKFTHLLRFVQYLFDDANTAKKAKSIIEGIFTATGGLRMALQAIFGGVRRPLPNEMRAQSV